MSPTHEELNVIDYVKTGEYIQAIKLRREQTGESLKEAKEYVDNLKFANELKVLKCSSIDEMKTRIEQMNTIRGNQKEFLLDIIDEAFYLGEDNGSQSGYMKALEENTTQGQRDEDEISEQAYEDGYADGSNDSQEESYYRGKEEGYESGSEDGYESGYSDGKQEGYDDGYNTRVEEESE